ncbi:MAG TPA: hypothetical protein VNY30_20310 [Bryobacteraceae bacterium]|nr:hypothetical protein [Bryobacteraceae bacterium]
MPIPIQAFREVANPLQCKELGEAPPRFEREDGRTNAEASYVRLDSRGGLSLRGFRVLL